MKLRHWILLTLLMVLVGCNQPSPENATPTAPRPTSTLGSVSISTTKSPDVKPAARAYLDAWKADNYETMYSLLTKVSQDAISKEDFTKHYQGVAAEAALSSLDYEILSSLVNNIETAQVSYRVILHSVLVGDIKGETVMNLRLEKGQWRVEWADTLVLPQLAGGNYLAMDRYKPARANIYDRNEHALVTQADATAIGIYPDNVLADQVDALFGELANLLNIRVETIQGKYNSFSFGTGWYLPLGEVTADRVSRRFDYLSGFSGLELVAYKARFYPDGGIAPHVVGYVRTIQPDELEKYKRLGYLQDERVGGSGLELWGEKYLAGKRGGALYVYNAQHQLQTKLGETNSQPSQAIYTTLDRDLQLGAQQAIAGFKGAIVVMERDTGRVLAMVSSPGFDPNAFEPVNYNSFMLLNALGNEDKPLFNRATQGQYPLGSVFKIITTAAALESGIYTPQTTYFCGSTFDELPGVTLHDWTFEKGLPPSGKLTVPQGLIRSCNPFFYHIGLDLFNRGLTTAVSEMARNFGLGKITGIEGVVEEAGQIPDPTSQLDATNGSTGQGAMLVTPLQVADFIAAVGNGGILYRPQIIEKIAPPDGDPTFVFKPEVRGRLPIKEETLKVIQEALRGVVSSNKPRGTAYHVFSGFSAIVAGKTGTAQSGSGLPHAWFAGYTLEGRQGKPDIAIAVVVENIGEGSDYAAPIFRRVVELYFQGKPTRYYWWESQIGVTKTPAPEVTETPTPEP